LRFTIALVTCAQLSLIAACAVSRPAPVGTATQGPTPAPAASSAYRAGSGVIESASIVSLASSPSATAGGSTGAPPSATMAYRLKMDDGSTQNIVQSGERFAVGDRVQVTNDGRLSRR
jgi:hypothetical protein